MHKSLDQLVKTHWVRKELTNWEILFYSTEPDYDLYYIESWNISLEKNWNKFISLWAWELIWEKSFVLKEPKPIDAKASWDNTVVYCLENEKFHNISEQEKNSVYSQLIVFLSNRIYKLNDVLIFISFINSQILLYERWSQKENLYSLCEKLIQLDWYLVMKYEFEEINNIIWSVVLDSELITFIQNLINEKIDIKIWKNFIYIKSDEYIYMLYWQPKVEYYILSNALLYAKTIFKYLWEKIEAKRNKDFLESMDK